MNKSAQAKQRIIRRCRKIVRDCEQTIIDAEYWNGLSQNQHNTPIDVEGFRVHRAWALKVLKQFGVAPGASA